MPRVQAEKNAADSFALICCHLHRALPPSHFTHHLHLEIVSALSLPFLPSLILSTKLTYTANYRENAGCDEWQHWAIS